MPESRTCGHPSLSERQRVEGDPHRVKRNVEDSGSGGGGASKHLQLPCYLPMPTAHLATQAQEKLGVGETHRAWCSRLVIPTLWGHPPIRRRSDGPKEVGTHTQRGPERSSWHWPKLQLSCDFVP